MPSPDTVRRRTAFALRGCHYSAQQSDRMCSTAENPSVAQIASCRCSWPGPPAILSGRAITRSNPPQQRSVKIPYLAAMLRKSRLSEPDSSADGYFASTVGKHGDEAKIGRYVQSQGQVYKKIHEDKQLSLF